jgi:hypothetical protein
MNPMALIDLNKILGPITGLPGSLVFRRRPVNDPERS